MKRSGLLNINHKAFSKEFTGQCPTARNPVEYCMYEQKRRKWESRKVGAVALMSRS